MGKELGWTAAKIRCDLCGNETLSVYHTSCDKLECSNCWNFSYFEVLENVLDNE